ncbi:hypothetical protein RhiXN_10582 [Rhizoctonia solani]|uniref:Uncharacterized protein n=1 Tax=Rhizoctonia solani TaxID=456999 RepID=A0A8H8P416_9AGAM|nr:uncharacterized protein RhiXN_10582 [Rhizoctonia solani]QRW24258.1 hypothetical protein RhiXN_10582 [Rhizoctonia solani]
MAELSLHRGPKSNAFLVYQRLSAQMNEKFMRLWKPYERTVEALYCHGSLTPEEEGQYLRLHQAIGDTPV